MIRSTVLTRVTDGRTGGIGVAYTRYSMLSRVKIVPKGARLTSCDPLNFSALNANGASDPLHVRF